MRIRPGEADEPTKPPGPRRGRTFQLGTSKTVALIAVLWVGALLRARNRPPDEDPTQQMFALLLLAGVAFLLFRLVARAIGGRTELQAREAPRNGGPDKTGILSARPLLLSVVALGISVAWTRASLSFQSLVVTEGGYYLLLLSVGCLFSRWCNSKEHVPLLFAVLSLAAVVAWGTIEFLNDPAVRFRLGPETSIVVHENALIQMQLLPLDAVVTWGGWLIGEATQSATRRALRGRQGASGPPNEAP